MMRTYAGVPCACNEVVGELARGVRMHFTHYVKQLETHTWHDAQRGLAHSYSRARVKFNVNRMDNMIIQARIALQHAVGCSVKQSMRLHRTACLCQIAVRVVRTFGA